MGATVLVGGQFGSEGKGKIASYLAHEFDMSIRTGGPNAGHTIEHSGRIYKLQSIPCAFINRQCMLGIGAGGIIDLSILEREIQECEIRPGQLVIDAQAVIIEDKHVNVETSLKDTIGSTGKGVGAAVSGKVLRGNNVKLARHISSLQDFLGDVAYQANELIDRGKKVFLEGTQGFGLSLHHGFYPFVTSRDTTASVFCSEAGISPRFVEDIIMVIRTYPIRVGGNSGPLKDEISWEIITQESKSSNSIIEMTTVTNKVRRVARFDTDLIRRSVTINRPTQIALNFADYIDSKNKSVQKPEQLTDEVLEFIDNIEKQVGVPITLIGTGPNHADIVDLRKQKRLA